MSVESASAQSPLIDKMTCQLPWRHSAQLSCQCPWSLPVASSVSAAHRQNDLSIAVEELCTSRVSFQCPWSLPVASSESAAHELNDLSIAVEDVCTSQVSFQCPWNLPLASSESAAHELNELSIAVEELCTSQVSISVSVESTSGQFSVLLWFASTAWALSLSQWTPRALPQRQNVRWTRHTLQLVPVTQPLSGASMALVCNTDVHFQCGNGLWSPPVDAPLLVPSHDHEYAFSSLGYFPARLSSSTPTMTSSPMSTMLRRQLRQLTN